MHNEGVTSTLFVNTVPLTLKTLVTLCGMFVEPRRIERTCLFRQPHDGSTFHVFVAGETIS